MLDPWVAIVSGIAFYVIYLVVTAIHEAFFTPLAKFPGPVLNALTRFPRMVHFLRGTEVRYLTSLHAAYGPVVRASPRELSYTEGAQAWKDIYGFTKNGVAGNKDRQFYSRPTNGVESVSFLFRDGPFCLVNFGISRDSIRRQDHEMC